MTSRGMLGTLVTGGILAAVGYLLMPRRRNRFMEMSRWISRGNVMKMGRFLMKAVAR